MLVTQKRQSRTGILLLVCAKDTSGTAAKPDAHMRQWQTTFHVKA